MSGETVTSQNSLQFTNDNKYAYIYSGASTITSGAYTKGLEFSTNSEYILGEYQITSDDTTSSDLYYKISFNGVVILSKFNKNPNVSDPVGFSPIQFVIPPFTTVLIEAQRGSGTDYNVFHLLTGKVGMAQRVGNLVDE